MRRLLLLSLLLPALCLPSCGTVRLRSAEQRTQRPTLPTAPASLLSGEHHQPPEGEQANGFVNGYSSAANALRRANVKLAGWITLWRCSANALATGQSTEGCNGEAIAAMDAEAR
jgi:hypothetical protein